MTKTRFLLLLALATAQVCMADDYQPFAKEGRTWAVGASNDPPELLYFSGDTIIDGHKCHKVWHHSYYRVWPQLVTDYDVADGPCSAGAVYEEDKKVYLYYYDKAEPILLYNFGANKGDILDSRLCVADVDTLHRNGRSFRRLFLKYHSNGQVSESSSYADIWIEGIGGPACFLPVTDRNRRRMYNTMPLLSCWENGEEIFCRADISRSDDDAPYLPMLTTGKKWEYSFRNPDNPPMDYQFSYELRSDTLLCGFPYYRLYSNNVGNSGTEKFEGLLCETNGAVYIIPKAINRLTRKLYDFGITEARPVEFGINSSYCYGTDCMEPNGVSRRVLWMGYRDKYGTGTGSGIVGCWVEGIGNNQLLTDPELWEPSRYIHLDKCTLNGEVLFTEADFHLPEPVPPAMQRAEYRPMFSEGKVWHYTYRNWMEDIEKPIDYAVRGDTVIDGKTYFKLYQEDAGVRTYWGAWREEEKKIYRYTGNTEQLFLDFGLHYHGQMPFTYTGYSPIYFEKTEVFKSGMGDCFTRHYYINEKYDPSTQVFIEGIGNRDGLINPSGVHGGPVSMPLNSVEENGRIIYTDADFYRDAIDYSDDITAPRATRQSSPVSAIFDLQGRRLNAVPARGMYVKNGKKYVK